MLSGHEIDDIAERLKEWLIESNEELDHPSIVALEERLGCQDGAVPRPNIGLVQLAEAFTALRHEAKLQTKSARTLQQDLQEGLSQLAQATVALRTAEESAEQHATEKSELLQVPLIEALLDIDEALFHASGMLNRQTNNGDCDALVTSLESEFKRLPKWRRLVSRFWHERLIHEIKQCDAHFAARTIDAPKEGLRIVQSRLQRALTTSNIERLECDGRQVDPNTMRVVETIQDSSKAAGTVVEELRPGYRWKGKLIRHAEVIAIAE